MREDPDLGWGLSLTTRVAILRRMIIGASLRGMSPITIRPRIQIALLVICFAVFLLIGTTYFNADVIAKRDWFGIILGVTIVPASLWGIWRALRLGIRIDDNGIRIR